MSRTITIELPSSIADDLADEISQQMIKLVVSKKQELQGKIKVTDTNKDGKNKREKDGEKEKEKEKEGDYDEYEGEYEDSYEVKSVLNHKIENGKFSFFLKFSDNSTQWIEDDSCECDWLISQYLQKVGIKTAYLICRVSSKIQNDRVNAISLEAQEDSLLKFINKEEPKYQRIKVIKIVGTAYNGIPKRMKSILEASIIGDGIYVWRIDRLSRNTIFFSPILEDLYKRGIKVFSLSENLAYTNETKTTFLQHLLDAQKDANAIGSRIRESYRYRKSRGDEAVGKLRYGKKYKTLYKQVGKGNNKEIRVDKNIVVDDDAESLVIKRIKTEHCTSQVMATRLNNAGITKRGKKWTPASITRIRNDRKF